MVSNKQIFVGFILMILWSVTTALFQVMTGSVDQHFPVSTLCFYAFTITTLLFTIGNYQNFPNLIQKCSEHKQDVLFLNFTTLGCWFFQFYPLKYIEPSIVGALYLGLAPIVSLFAGRILYKNQKINLQDYIVSIILTIVIIYLANLCFGEHSALKNTYSFDQTMLALVCIFIGGIALGINTLYTKRLSAAKFSPTDILTIRFILLIFVTGFYQFFIDQKPALSLINVGDIILIAFGMIIIPQLLFQNSINRIDPISTGIIALLMPVLAFFIEFVDQRLSPNIWTIIGVLLIFCIATVGAILRYRTEKV